MEIHEQIIWSCKRIVNPDGTEVEGEAHPGWSWCTMCNKWLCDEWERVDPDGGIHGSHLTSPAHTDGVVSLANCNDAGGKASFDNGLRNLGWTNGCLFISREENRSYWGIEIEMLPMKFMQKYNEGVPVVVEWNNKRKNDSIIPPHAIKKVELALTPYQGDGKYIKNTIAQVKWSQLPESEAQLKGIPQRTLDQLGLLKGSVELGYWPILMVFFESWYMEQLVLENRAT